MKNADPVADVLAVECEEHHLPAGEMCGASMYNGVPMFCASRIRAALAMPRGEAREAESLAASPLPTERCEICHGVGLFRPRFNRGTLADCPRGCKGTVTR